MFGVGLGGLDAQKIKDALELYDLQVKSITSDIEKSARAVDSLATPWEKAAEAVQEYARWLDFGYISQLQFTQLANKANEQAEAAERRMLSGIHQAPLVGAMGLNSVEALQVRGRLGQASQEQLLQQILDASRQTAANTANRLAVNQQELN